MWFLDCFAYETLQKIYFQEISVHKKTLDSRALENYKWSESFIQICTADATENTASLSYLSWRCSEGLSTNFRVRSSVAIETDGCRSTWTRVPPRERAAVSVWSNLSAACSHVSLTRSASVSRSSGLSVNLQPRSLCLQKSSAFDVTSTLWKVSLLIVGYFS